MKMFVCLALIAVGALSFDAVAASPLKERVSGVNGWYVPQVNGSLEWVTFEEAKQLKSHLQGRASPVVSFYLYTRKNPSTPQILVPQRNSIDSSNFDSAKRTRILVHGWQQRYSDDLFKKLTAALLEQEDYNVIVVDWEAARNFYYFTSSSAVAQTGKTVAQMISMLQQYKGVSLDSLQVIGHSLGAHVSGFVGKSLSSGKISSIFALDPAMPDFRYDSPSKRLAESDASYVEVIHSCAGKLGFVEPIGSVDFYVNGGEDQPGCYLDFMGTCAHARSVEYFTEAVKGVSFRSYQCASYESAKKQECSTSLSSATMASPRNAYNARGVFFVPVKEKAPFAV